MVQALVNLVRQDWFSGQGTEQRAQGEFDRVLHNEYIGRPWKRPNCAVDEKQRQLGEHSLIKRAAWHPRVAPAVTAEAEGAQSSPRRRRWRAIAALVTRDWHADKAKHGKAIKMQDHRRQQADQIETKLPRTRPESCPGTWLHSFLLAFPLANMTLSQKKHDGRPCVTSMSL